MTTPRRLYYCSTGSYAIMIASYGLRAGKELYQKKGKRNIYDNGYTWIEVCARHRFESLWGHWVIPLLTLTLTFHVYPQRSHCKPTSTLLPVASSLQHPCSNNVLRLFLYHACTLYNKHNKSKRVACCHQTFKKKEVGAFQNDLCKQQKFKSSFTFNYSELPTL
jgi:hypothetical protein